MINMIQIYTGVVNLILKILTPAFNVALAKLTKMDIAITIYLQQISMVTIVIIIMTIVIGADVLILLILIQVPSAAFAKG